MTLDAMITAIGVTPYYRDEYGVLYCADCLTILPKIPDKSIDLVVTSPPYNMRTRIRNGEYTTRERSEHFSKKYRHFGDDLPIDKYYAFHQRIIEEALRVAPLAFWNIAIVTGSKEAWCRLIGNWSLHIRDIFVWDKGAGQPAMHDSVVNRCTELIIALESNGTAGRAFEKVYFERGTMADIWRLPSSESIDGHAATFPTELPGRVIRGWSAIDSIILDPFCGSGTTLVAAKQLGRKFIGVEISEEYCKICVERLKQRELFS